MQTTAIAHGAVLARKRFSAALTVARTRLDAASAAASAGSAASVHLTGPDALLDDAAAALATRSLATLPGAGALARQLVEAGSASSAIPVDMRAGLAAVLAEVAHDIAGLDADTHAAEVERLETLVAMNEDIADIGRTWHAGILSLFAGDDGADTAAAGSALLSASTDLRAAADALDDARAGVAAAAVAELANADAAADAAAAERRAANTLSWSAGDAALDLGASGFTLGGAMTITAVARFDDLAGGDWQRLFDFGNGAFGDNILMGQRAGSSDMVFQIYRDGLGHEVKAAGAIVAGETATWTARITGDGMMSIFKNGEALASSQQVAARTVARYSNLIGDSNWSWDDPLIGAVHGIVINRWAATDAEIAAAA